MDDDCAIKAKHARIDFVDSSRGIEKKSHRHFIFEGNLVSTRCRWLVCNAGAGAGQHVQMCRMSDDFWKVLLFQEPYTVHFIKKIYRPHCLSSV